MTRRAPPDPLTLDAMVLGTDGDEDLGAWEKLLASPDASTIWGAAVERRRRVDALASVIARQPWLASMMLGWRRAMRRAPMLASWSAEVRFASPLAATLAPPDQRGLALKPGATEVLEMALGETVNVTLPPGATLRQVTSHGVQPASLSGWTMDADEAPVVLVATRSGDVVPIATLILIESEKIAG